ncbi:MAG: helix-turn-helix transcriptional regulator [Actinomycetota bacterium]|nr:helix-turn-helix transcriptional regulator [Actinomycetota bacterium]
MTLALAEDRTQDGAGRGDAAPDDAVRRSELARFLRSRRERITPDEVGLASGGRRRTPGLRREEVASLAGVGVTWYTWLEQARAIRASAAVADAIARALLLDPTERRHLFALVGVGDPVPHDACDAVPSGVRSMVDELDPLPAAVVNARHDLLAHNRAYNHLVADLDAVPVEERNCMWLVFTHPAWRDVLEDWEDVACRMVAQFRACMAEHLDDSSWSALVDRLHAESPEFARLWSRNEVRAPDTTTRRFRHPRVGRLELRPTAMWLAPRHGTRLLTYTPADATTRARLDDLVAPDHG